METCSKISTRNSGVFKLWIQVSSNLVQNHDSFRKVMSHTLDPIRLENDKWFLIWNHLGNFAVKIDKLVSLCIPQWQKFNKKARFYLTGYNCLCLSLTNCDLCYFLWSISFFVVLFALLMFICKYVYFLCFIFIFYCLTMMSWFTSHIIFYF